MNKFLILCVFIACSFLGNAQNAIILGKVIDAESGESLFSATVKTSDGATGTITDLDGKFEIEMPEGVESIAIEISYIGYATVAKTIFRGNISEFLTIKLELSASLLQIATVTSGKYEKPLGETTVSMEVLGPELIENINATSVDNVLNKTPGVNLIGDQADIRGGSGFSYGAGSRVMLLVDDVPALQADAGTPNWGDVPVENIEQIEIIKGAASALYGSAALNGVINIRTGYAKSEPITKASMFGQLFFSPNDKGKKWWDDYNRPFAFGATLLHKQKIKKLDLVLSGFLFKREDFNEENFRKQLRFTANTRYRINDRLSIGAKAIINPGRSHSFFYWRDSESNAHKGDTSTYSESAKVRFFIDPFATYFDKHDNRHKFTGRYFRIKNDLTNNQSNGSHFLYGEYQFQKKWDLLDLVFTSGVVASKNYVTAELYGDTTYTTRNLAAYAQIEKKLFDKLTLSMGVRIEQNLVNTPEIIGTDTIPGGEIKESKPVPRFGLNYQVAPYTYLRTSWGRGYRFPTIAEKFITTDLGGIPINPNLSLTSETGWSAEVGIKQGFRLAGFEGFVDVALFWSRYEDMIEFVFLGGTAGFGLEATNVGNTDIKGLDFSISGKGNFGAVSNTLLAGYTYINPKFQEFTELQQIRSSVDYNILKYRYKHTIKLDWESKYKQYSVGVAVFYNSFMEAIDSILEAPNLGVPGLQSYRQENNSGTLVLDARVAYRIKKMIKFSLIMNNVFNKEYSIRPGQLRAPRNLTFRVDGTF